jgi:hypothetical protein
MAMPSGSSGGAAGSAPAVIAPGTASCSSWFPGRDAGGPVLSAAEEERRGYHFGKEGEMGRGLFRGLGPNGAWRPFLFFSFSLLFSFSEFV